VVCAARRRGHWSSQAFHVKIASGLPPFMTTCQITEKINQVLERGSRAVLATLVAGAPVGAKLLIEERGGMTGSLGNAGLDQAVFHQAISFLQSRDDAKTLKTSEFVPAVDQFSDAAVLFERVEAEPRLVIAGAGHVGASLARLAAMVGYQVTLIDDRAEFVKRDLFSSPSESAIELVAANDWEPALREAIGNGHGTSVAIVTRGHKQDEDCLRAAIDANPDYVGMIGSKRRTNIVLDKLREEGVNEGQLKKVHAPIGLDIGAVSPEEVALAILAEIVSDRRGGKGASLSAWRRKPA
jgi:xanthine dehydrogenase accessory factor